MKVFLFHLFNAAEKQTIEENKKRAAVCLERLRIPRRASAAQKITLIHRRESGCFGEAQVLHQARVSNHSLPKNNPTCSRALCLERGASSLGLGSVPPL